MTRAKPHRTSNHSLIGLQDLIGVRISVGHGGLRTHPLSQVVLTSACEIVVG